MKIQRYDFVTGIETAAAPDATAAAEPGDAFILGLKTQFTIVDNQSSAANVTDAVWSKTTYRSVILLATAYRSASGGSTRAETFHIMMVNDGTNWACDVRSVAAQGASPAGLTFSVTSAGQLQYVSDANGGSYSAATSWLKWSVLDIVEAA